MSGRIFFGLVAAGAVAVFGAFSTGTTPARAGDGLSVTEFSSQAREQRRPARVRIYRERSYPGPNAVRQCTSRLVQEHRPSGTVIVPDMHCWWERG